MTDISDVFVSVKIEPQEPEEDVKQIITSSTQDFHCNLNTEPSSPNDTQTEETFADNICQMAATDFVMSDTMPDAMEFVDCKVEPSSPLHDSSSSMDFVPPDFVSCKMETEQEEDEISHVNQLLRQKYHGIGSTSGLVQAPNWKCSFCGKYYKTEIRLQKHLKRHTDQVFCQFCEKGFGLRSSLVRHVASKHSSRIFDCSFCGKIMSTSSSLQRHIGVHTKPYACHLCGLTFAYKVVLQNHVGQHDGSKFQCDLCDASFGCVAYLNGHKYSHAQSLANETGSGFKCKYCDRRFVRKDRLRIHVLELHEKPKDPAFRCEFCLKDFATAIRYRLHRKRVHLKPRRRVEGEYKCQICEQSFRFDKELQFHQEEHETDKKYACPSCPENFSSLTNLSCHQKSHKM